MIRLVSINARTSSPASMHKRMRIWQRAPLAFNVEKSRKRARVLAHSPANFDRCSHAYTSHQQTIFWWNLNSVKYEKFYGTVVYCVYIIHALPKAALNKKINSFVSDSLIWMAYTNYVVVLIKNKIKKKIQGNCIYLSKKRKRETKINIKHYSRENQIKLVCLCAWIDRICMVFVSVALLNCSFLLVLIINFQYSLLDRAVVFCVPAKKLY